MVPAYNYHMPTQKCLELISMPFINEFQLFKTLAKNSR